MEHASQMEARSWGLGRRLITAVLPLISVGASLRAGVSNGSFHGVIAGYDDDGLAAYGGLGSGAPAAQQLAEGRAVEAGVAVEEDGRLARLPGRLGRLGEGLAVS